MTFFVWQVIEKEAKNFIDESFKTLRSAEAAFDMLLKFKHIRSREAINRQMMMKFNDILAQYCKEVNEKYIAAVTVKMYLAKCEQLNRTVACLFHLNAEKRWGFPKYVT